MNDYHSYLLILRSFVWSDETPRLFEGDIMLTESQKEANKAKVRKTRNAEEISSSNASMTSQVPSIPSTDIHRTWPNGRVPYKFGQLLGQC